MRTNEPFKRGSKPSLKSGAQRRDALPAGFEGTNACESYSGKEMNSANN